MGPVNADILSNASAVLVVRGVCCGMDVVAGGSGADMDDGMDGTLFFLAVVEAVVFFFLISPSICMEVARD